jgi:FtsP/CotA-like multicopper oxidase with cupredoxin domain
MPIQVIGSDGGLLPAAVTKEYVTLMPGERLDVWADFSELAGQQVRLQSAAFTPGGMGMMGGMMGGHGRMGGGMAGDRMGGAMGRGRMGGGMGMMGGSSLANGAAFDILTIQVGREATSQPQLGALPPLTVRYDSTNVPDFDTPYTVELAMQHMMAWTLNGRVYEDMAVAEDEKVSIDRVLTWEWINNSPIPHPMHIHNIQFQVVQRTPPPVASSYGEINQGLVDSGWKDTVLVWPGERVKVAMKFGPHTGMYMYHCHILEHEDMTMMRNLMVMDSMGPAM